MTRNDGPSAVSDLACWVTMGIYVLGLFALGMQLKHLQVDSSADYSLEKGRQSVRRVQTAGARGRILDRHGRVLADNRRAVSILCDASRFQRRTWAATTQTLKEAIAAAGRVVGLESALTDDELRRHVERERTRPLVVWRDVDEVAVARFCEHASELPGFELADSYERVYPQGASGFHLLGYVGRARGASEAGDVRFSFFDRELNGRAGVEAYYDGFLRGVPGERQVLVDARGFACREWTVTPASAGPDLELSVDWSVQRAAEEALEGLRGACVAIDPRDGSVLALASAPGTDPNRFVPQLPRAFYQELLDDPDKPLLNRASGGLYPPGSTFKPVTALAALRAGAASGATTFDCSGVYKLGKMRLRCSRRWGHGTLDLRQAIKWSCNPYFCHLGMETGTNALVQAAKAFGLGRRTGIDFGVDAPGTVPDDAWKRRRYNERWYPGDLMQMSIGQGMLLVTPLQMACVAGALGTGFLVRPHLKRDLPTRRTPLAFAADAQRLVREGMRQVVDGGSGAHGDEGVEAWVIGKTGTAEIGFGKRKRKNTWFIAYAESGRRGADGQVARDEKGRVRRCASPGQCAAVALVVEDGDSGGGTAAPRVAAVLRSLFNRSAPVVGKAGP